eukprot:CAMPEP_0197593006 /NCGR_PEP_ID=MMETSP1326-20131121/16844_1 /TAXON_ID=1155430 /ORGANISM="Genus nov. species nov., Strain RCC2288" /LENGTH=176 /DNA_ID=CAMNT_0043158867 /DNA_START=80 /DNA_END=610 /DNA_ORIENTATION=-
MTSLAARTLVSSAAAAAAARGPSSGKWRGAATPAVTVRARRSAAGVPTAHHRAIVTAASAADAAGGASGGLNELVTKKNAENVVVVWSKSWCPYCLQVKKLFDKMGVEYMAVEIDKFHEEQDIMTALVGLTQQRTVPNVFVGGQHVGGCDDTMAKHRSGELAKMLESAGVTDIKQA